MKREDVRHKRALNLLGDTYYKQWAALYVRQYTQRMKPMLEAYWATAVVYLRNMVTPEVAAREYFRVYGVFAEYALKAGKHAGDGGAFVYVAATKKNWPRSRMRSAARRPRCNEARGHDE